MTNNKLLTEASALFHTEPHLLIAIATRAQEIPENSMPEVIAQNVERYEARGYLPDYVRNYALGVLCKHARQTEELWRKTVIPTEDVVRGYVSPHPESELPFTD